VVYLKVKENRLLKYKEAHQCSNHQDTVALKTPKFAAARKKYFEKKVFSKQKIIHHPLKNK